MRKSPDNINRLSFEEYHLTDDYSGGDLRGMRVLIADFDKIGRELLAKVLCKRMGMEVGTADNGSLAIAEALSGNYDAAIIDLFLPRTSGLEAIRAIKKMKPDFPILAVTSNAIKDTSSYARSFGIDQLCSKPVSIASLIDLLKKILGGQGLARR